MKQCTALPSGCGGCLRRGLTTILALAAEIRQGTIDRVMDKSDLELGLEVLLGIRPPP